MIDEKMLEYFIDKMGILGQEILVQDPGGGFNTLLIERKDIIDFFSHEVNGTFIDFINLKNELEAIKEIYSSPENILNSDKMSYFSSHNHANYDYETGGCSNLLPVDEYIDLIYEFKNLEDIASKDKFKFLLGTEFLFLASVNYQLAAETRMEGKKKKSKYSKGVVYLLKIKGKQQFKIGVSKTFKKRYHKLSTLMPFELETVNTVKSNHAFALESELHNKFSNKKIKGEWFKLTQEDIDYICSIKADF